MHVVLHSEGILFSREGDGERGCEVVFKVLLSLGGVLLTSVHASERKLREYQGATGLTAVHLHPAHLPPCRLLLVVGWEDREIW